jgi:hypothetical protein
MKLECNIDQRGRLARLVTGLVTDTAGVGLIVWGVIADRTGLVVTGGLLSAAGTFMVFEGVVGWCAARALGIKTRL